MEQLLTDLSCEGFAEALASKAPVPGGGGAAALVGSLASALCGMVGNLTSGRKKYAEYEEDIQRMIKEAEELRSTLLMLVDRDAENFEPLSKAYSIPKDDPDRDEILTKVSLDACVAPLRMMECCCRVIELLEEMRIKGSVLLRSDVGCGAILAKAAMECASMNVFINTKSLECEAARAMEEKADGMLGEYGMRAQDVADLVMDSVHR